MALSLNNNIRLIVLLPVFIGIICMVLITIVPVNIYKSNWNTITRDNIMTSTLFTAETSVLYSSKYIETYFSQTENDINVLSSYITDSVNNKLNVSKNYENYFGVSNVDSKNCQNDHSNYPFQSSSFLKGITSTNELYSLNPYFTNHTTIYDNAFRAVYKSSSIYIQLYMGFEENGFFRSYPCANLDGYVTLSYTCYYNGLPTVGYDPRCRIWYNLAKNDDSVHYTSPYVDAFTHNVIITSSKRVMNGSTLLGIIGMDYSMQEVDNAIVNNNNFGSGYLLLMDSFGNVISYPNLDRSIPRTIFNIESHIDISVWNNILTSNSANVNHILTKKDGSTWYLVYKYIQNVKYYVVLMYPVDYPLSASDDIINSSYSKILIGTIVIPIIGCLLMLLGVCYIHNVGNKYTNAITSLSNDIKEINNANYDIEIGNKAPVSAEFTTLNNCFGNLLVAVKFGNEAYYNGNMEKALQSYEQAEKLMTTLKSERGMSICYNNKANVLKQLGKIIEAEKLYNKSIEIILKLKENNPSKSKAYDVMISYRLMNLGVMYKDSGNLIKSKDLLERSLMLARDTDNSIGIGKISGNLGQLYLELSNNSAYAKLWNINNLDFAKQARDIIYDAYDSVKKSHDEISIQYAMMNMGLYEKHNKNYTGEGSALYWFHNILNNNSHIDPYVEQIVLNNTYDIFMSMQRFHEANQIKSVCKQIDSSIQNILFVLDISGSMDGAFLRQCKESIIDILNNYVADNDNISMLIFNDVVTTLFDNKTKHDDIENMKLQIGKLKASGKTAFYDALRNAIDKISLNNDNNSKWVIALTDGADTDSKLENKPNQLAKLLNKININLIIITVGKLDNKKEIQYLCDCAKNKGKGVLIEIENNPDGIQSAFKKVARLITGQLHVESL